MIGGAGGLAGPDLSAIGVTAPIDYLTESLLKPEQAVKDGYALIRIVHTDGGVATGNLMGETEAEVLVRDAAGRVERIPKSRIRTREIIPGSLMPAGASPHRSTGKSSWTWWPFCLRWAKKGRIARPPRRTGARPCGDGAYGALPNPSRRESGRRVPRSP